MTGRMMGMSAGRIATRLGRILQGLLVVHPLPSAINAVLVGCLAVIAGGGLPVAAVSAIAMLGFQTSIGALNDLVDAEQDRLVKPGKPIPAGLVSRRIALGIVISGGLVGLTISAGLGAVVLVLGAAGYASGLAYDLFMRRHGLGWLCFVAAFPLLLAWTWMAAVNSLPPGWPFILPLAAIAGPAIHLANSLVDLDADVRSGATSLATQLGPRRARQALAMLLAIVYVLAWASLLVLGALPDLALFAALLATLSATVGLTLSWRPAARARETGWLLQAVGLALMASAWLAAIVAN